MLEIEFEFEITGVKSSGVGSPSEVAAATPTLEFLVVIVEGIRSMGPNSIGPEAGLAHLNLATICTSNSTGPIQAHLQFTIWSLLISTIPPPPFHLHAYICRVTKSSTPLTTSRRSRAFWSEFATRNKKMRNTHFSNSLEYNSLRFSRLGPFHLLESQDREIWCGKIENEMESIFLKSSHEIVYSIDSRDMTWRVVLFGVSLRQHTTNKRGETSLFFFNFLEYNSLRFSCLGPFHRSESRDRETWHEK